jgi:hypothetical protein
MINLHDSDSLSNGPPGVSSDFLIEPQYVRHLGWSLYCIPDRPTFRQLSLLMGSKRSDGQHVYAYFAVGSRKEAVSLEGNPHAISAFLAEMVGGDVCVYDLPNSFLICVLEGDISILAASPERIVRCVGALEMNRSSWLEIVSALRKDIRERLSAKYIDGMSE